MFGNSWKRLSSLWCHFSCFSHATASRDPITKQSYSARNLRRGVVCTSPWSSSRGRKKEVCAQDIYEVRVIFQSEKKFPMLSSTSIAAASCQRKLKLDNSSCRFSFATSVQKTVKLQKKIIYVFYRLLSSLIKKFFNYFFLFPSFLSTDYSHPLNSPNDRNNFSFFFIFHVCNNARD